MEHWERIAELERLDKRTFLFEKKQFTVYKINYYMGSYYVYTVEQRTFVKDAGQFENFLRSIKVFPLDTDTTALAFESENIIIKPKPKNVMDAQSNATLTTAVSNTETINNELFKMFQTLSGNPTKEDYEKAEAMSKMANTMVSVSQTQINFIKIKNNL